MIEATLTGAAQFTQPVYVASGQYLAIQILQRTTTPSSSLVAQFEIQIIPDADGQNLPNASDTRWAAADTFDVASNPVHKSGQVNRAFYRVGIPTGKYTSGQADVKMWFTD